MSRALRPRQPIAVFPLAIGTENCLNVGGITPRKLREALAAHPDVPRSRLGHTLIVEPQHFLLLLEKLRVAGDDTEDTKESDGQPETVDGVLSALGKERVR